MAEVSESYNQHVNRIDAERASAAGAQILTFIETSHGPVLASDAREAVYREGHSLRSIHHATWGLIGSGQIALTDERLLVVDGISE